MNDVLNNTPFLRTSRNFPDDPKQLAVEVNRSYVDIAYNVNRRTVGLFTINRSSVTGENWFFNKNQRQQGLREVYQFSNSDFTGGVATIAHGIQFNSVSNFIRIWGTFFDGTNWQNLPYVDVVNVTNQINIKVNSTNIVITKGAGTPPATNNGLIVLEWLANP